MLNAPTSLVTGGAGFLGSHVADALLRMGHRVIVLDDLSGGFEANIPCGAHFARGSALDPEAVSDLFEQWQFDYVYHLAAYAAEGLSHFIRRFNYENNLLGSVNLINEAVRHRVKCFVFTSSIAVYGSIPPPMIESCSPEPKDPYGVAKLAVELDLRAAREIFGLNSIIFRPHNVYGERQNLGDRYRNVVGIFMNRLLQGQPMPIFGDGEQKRAFSYVGDVAPVIARSVEVEAAYNEVFNIGAEIPCSVNELGKAVSEAFGLEFNPEYLPVRMEAREVFAGHAKLHAAFGTPALTSLPEGLRRMAAWAREAGARQSQPFKHIELDENLPPSWRQ